MTRFLTRNMHQTVSRSFDVLMHNISNKVSVTCLRVLLSLIFGLFPTTAALAQSSGPITPVVTVSPSVFPIGQSSSLFLSVTETRKLRLKLVAHRKEHLGVILHFLPL